VSSHSFGVGLRAYQQCLRRDEVLFHSLSNSVLGAADDDDQASDSDSSWSVDVSSVSQSSYRRSQRRASARSPVTCPISVDDGTADLMGPLWAPAAPAPVCVRSLRNDSVSSQRRGRRAAMRHWSSVDDVVRPTHAASTQFLRVTSDCACLFNRRAGSYCWSCSHCVSPQDLTEPPVSRSFRHKSLVPPGIPLLPSLAWHSVTDSSVDYNMQQMYTAFRLSPDRVTVGFDLPPCLQMLLILMVCSPMDGSASAPISCVR
jgi:hypothetical protein